MELRYRSYTRMKLNAYPFELGREASAIKLHHLIDFATLVPSSIGALWQFNSFRQIGFVTSGRQWINPMPTGSQPEFVTEVRKHERMAEGVCLSPRHPANRMSRSLRATSPTSSHRPVRARPAGWGLGREGIIGVLPTKLGRPAPVHPPANLLGAMLEPPRRREALRLIGEPRAAMPFAQLQISPSLGDRPCPVAHFFARRRTLGHGL